MSGAAVDALLVDFGNVVVAIDFGRVFAAWSEDSGVPADRIAARFSFDAAYRAQERGEIDATAYFASLRKTLGIDLPDAAFLRGWNEVFREPVPGMAPLLETLAARCPLYLFSNTNAAHHAVSSSCTQAWPTSAKYCTTLGLWPSAHSHVPLSFAAMS